VGESVDEAAWWFIAMERCCQSQFLAESVGRPMPVDPENARATHAVSGSHFADWLHIHALFPHLLRNVTTLRCPLMRQSALRWSTAGQAACVVCQSRRRPKARAACRWTGVPVHEATIC
jgi:hypothetical protein